MRRGLLFALLVALPLHAQFISRSIVNANIMQIGGVSAGAIFDSTNNAVRIICVAGTCSGSGGGVGTDVNVTDRSARVLGVISGSVSVSNFPGSQAVTGSVSVSNFPGSQTVTGSVSVSNFPTTYDVSDRSARLLGSIANTGFNVNNFPATQTVSGSVSVSNFPSTTDVSDRSARLLGSITNTGFNVNNFPATQTVTGTVNVGNFPSTTDVSDRNGRLLGSIANTGFNVNNFPASQAVTGPLTDTQLRASAVPVSGPLTDTQLRASAVPVSGALTDTQLRATALPVSGPLTDTQLRASAVPVSGTIACSNCSSSGTLLKTFHATAQPASITFTSGTAKTVACIFKTSAMTTTYKLRRVRFATGTLTAAQVILELRRITADGTGTSFASNILSADAADTVNASLVAKHTYTVEPTYANGAFTALSFSTATANNLPVDEMVMYDYDSAQSTKPLTLRNGSAEGWCVIATMTGTTPAMTPRVVFIFTEE
jgi:hypothetical protein